MALSSSPVPDYIMALGDSAGHSDHHGPQLQHGLAWLHIEVRSWASLWLWMAAWAMDINSLS